MAENHTAGVPGVPTAATRDRRQTGPLENDYDELVDEDWLDMHNPARSALSAAHPSKLMLSDIPTSSNNNSNEDHLVPSLASSVDSSRQQGSDVPTASSPSTFSLHSDFEDALLAEVQLQARAQDDRAVSSAVMASTAATTPFLLPGPTQEELTEHRQRTKEEHVPGSTSPSTSSDSEYSLLNPSAEQSRKNSLSSLSGFQALTPNTPANIHSLLSQDQDQVQYQDQANLVINSPSFSDFVQVASDQGEDFSGMESVSARSSNNDTPSPASSERQNPLEEDDAAPSLSGPPLTMTVPASKGDSAGSRNTSAVPTTSASSSSAATSTPLLPPSPSARQTVYKTTVEDAEHSSGGEQRGGRQRSGIRHRGSHARPENQEDVLRSFFSTAKATSTMPGALNLGLDAEIPQGHGSAASTATAVNDPPVDERQCRICLGGADEEDTLGRLISPCLCKGSMKYVHVECLNAWRARSLKRESHYKCDTCKYSFSFRRTSFARYLAHPLTVFILTVIVFALAVFAAGFAMKLLLYLMMDEPQEFIYPADLDDYDDVELLHLKETVVIFKTPDSLRAVFSIDKTHMVFGSFFVSIIGFLQLLLSTLWMGGGGGVFRIGGFGLGGGRRRGARGERQREAGIGGLLMIMILVFGLFKSVYMTYQFVHRMSRRVLAKAELMVLEVQ